MTLVDFFSPQERTEIDALRATAVSLLTAYENAPVDGRDAAFKHADEAQAKLAGQVADAIQDAVKRARERYLENAAAMAESYVALFGLNMLTSGHAGFAGQRALTIPTPTGYQGHDSLESAFTHARDLQQELTDLRLKPPTPPAPPFEPLPVIRNVGLGHR